jgi:hypothetical protein
MDKQRMGATAWDVGDQNDQNNHDASHQHDELGCRHTLPSVPAGNSNTQL